MSKEYEIDSDEFTYYIDAEPVITDESFDHGLGVEVIMACTDVNILSVFKCKIGSKCDTGINEKEFRADEQAFEDLLDKVKDDYSSGVFDE